MKIGLIFPPSPYQTKETMPPLGIAWLAAVLRENGFKDVFLIDCVINKYSNEQVLELLKKEGPDLVGLSFGTQNRFYAFELAEMIKNNFPEIAIAVGGPHPTLTADDILKNISAIDIVGRGEGELTFLELVRAIDEKTDLRKVAGISFRQKNGQIVHNVFREPIQDLDSLPMPARDLLPIEKYRQTIPLSEKICTSVISSRGCPYNCVYCSTSEQWGHKIRHRSAKNVVDEIEFLMKNYQLDGVGFFDDVFTMNKARVIEICQEIISRKLNIGWWCEARANTIDEETVGWMKRSGCEHISMAIESGSEKILKNIKKGITLEQGINAAKIIKKAGIKQKVFFMHGLPGETYEDIKKTVFLSRYLKFNIGIEETTQTLTVIYPGTELERIAKNLGMLPKDFSWSKFYEEKRIYPPLDTCSNMPIFEQPDLSYEQIFKYVRRAKAVYYLQHPLTFLKALPQNKRNLKKWFTKNKK
jgi:anaerobic magnesium-protoporphyrin IX monomethyl ester cyclase